MCCNVKVCCYRGPSLAEKIFNRKLVTFNSSSADCGQLAVSLAIFRLTSVNGLLIRFAHLLQFSDYWQINLTTKEATPSGKNEFIRRPGLLDFQLVNH